jgi:putative colanic acid biosysnthesis UDP-glucose lipid carrier transferase
MRTKVGRYSKFIRPIIVFFDLFLINLFAYLFLGNISNSNYFLFFISLSWIIISLNIEFYEVYRFTKETSIINKIIKQFLLYTILCYSFLGFYDKNLNPKEIIIYILYLLVTITFVKMFIYYFLKKYRSFFGGNIRNVIIVGNGKNANSLESLFEKTPDYGCKVIKRFQFDGNKNDIINDALDFAINNPIDVIYCSLFKLTDRDEDVFIDFSQNNLKTVKFLPEDDVFVKNQNVEYYDYIPVLSIYKTYLDDPITRLIKRVFDIFFSVLVILLLLSWLVPLLAILIKIESKGPVFFKQGRPGINEKEFFCFKFRSMMVNQTTEKEASKNDPRVTKIGRFIRKTSLDEMPQFLNVLIGDMSVVGPRPHLWSQNKAYGNRIKKYMMRHYVKPGITGLAQVKGCRGEIENDEEMKSRIKYDIFYIENWSLIMDIKIIFQTVINIFQGEDKAY